MHRKEGGDKRTSPLVARRASQKRKEQERVGNVQKDIGEVIAARDRAENGRVEHPRQPCQRDPVAVVEFGKAPNQVSQREARLNVGAAAHFNRVIDGHESELARLPVDE